MQRKTVALAGAAGSFILTGAAAAGFIQVEFSSVDLGATDATTFRFYAIFDNPADQLLSISGNVAVNALLFQTSTQLLNDGGIFDGLKPEDFAQAPAAGAPWDSWVTIGSSTFAGNDTNYSPGFLGGDGVSRVIEGSFLSQFDNGGWYDSNPGTAEVGGTILIAQFTVENQASGGNAEIAFQGTVDYNPDGGPPLTSDAFFTLVHSPAAPGALLLLAPALFPGMRRRRLR